MLGSAPLHPYTAVLRIANDGKIAMTLHNLAKQLELCVRRVLEFVGHDKAIGVLDDAERPGLRFKQMHRQRQHGREVDCTPIVKVCFVSCAQLA
jgi:hypothetical protein